MFDADHSDSGMDFQRGKTDRTDPFTRYEGGGTPEGVIKARHPLDSQPNVLLHKRLLAMYEDELERQADNREQMAKDEDFYDGIQWSEQDARTLRERGQVPLVYNVIATSINWVLGTEKQGRTDYKILPRRADSAKPAERKTQLMKYLSDVNQSTFWRSSAFEECVKVGIGWLESSVQSEDDGEPVTSGYESWRNMLWDSCSKMKDLSDCRYITRSKWIDLDVAESIFPDRVGLLRSASAQSRSWGIDDQGDEAMDSQENELAGYNAIRTVVDGVRRERLRVIEMWFRKTAKVQRVVGGEFNGEVYDPANPAPAHTEAIESGEAILRTRVMMRMHCALFCAEGMLWLGESPYRHNDFPFTPIWCYRFGRDNLPYGMIRNMRDIQEDVNKRASKALSILSTNKTVMDEGAVDDIDEFAEENARPDGIIVKKAGKQLELNVDRELAAPHIELMSRGMQMIQSVSGVTDENLGRQTNASSGLAIGRRQEQGQLATAGIFDNLRLAVQLHGQKELSLIEQFFSEAKEFRITNQRGTPEYITINDGLPENDIARTKADFIISDSDWRASVRQSQTEALFGLLQQLAPVAPQIALVLLDLVVEGMDIASREEIVKRIRQATGQRDPDQTELTPEEKAELLAKQQAEQQAAALAQRMQMAEIGVKEGQAAKYQTDAGKSQAQTHQINQDSALKAIQTQMNAIQAALLALTNPGAVRVADGMLHEGGFQSRSELEDNAAQEQQALAAQQLLAQVQQEKQPQPQSQPQPQGFGMPMAA